LTDLSNKATSRDLSDIHSRMKTAEKNANGLVNHINEIQKQVDSLKSETGPDYEKMIKSLQKLVDLNQEVTSQRIYTNEKALEHLTSVVKEFKSLADKTDNNVIRLTQKVDSIQRKLDLLDEAFNGFMVPSNLLNPSADTYEFDHLKDSLSSLRKDFFKFKDECSSNFQTVGDSLSNN